MTEGNDGTSSDEEVYVDDFHEILEEIVLEMADYEEDRDEDPDLNGSDATLTNINFNEEEQKNGGSTADTTQEPNSSQTDSVTKRRSPATNAAAASEA